MKFDRGTVVLVSLDPALGHEQRGSRPCLIVSDATVTQDQRYPMVCVVPLSATPGSGALYPRLEPGISGLRKRSFALIDQLRAIDKRRAHRVFGSVSQPELAAVDEGLCLFLGLRIRNPSP